jgi:hypothetical protein
MVINPKARAPNNRFGQDVNGMGSIGRAGPTSQCTIHSSLDRVLKTIVKTRLTAGKLRIMNYIHYEGLRPRIRIGKINMSMSHANLSGDNRPSLFRLDAEQQAILDQADRFAQKDSTHYPRGSISKNGGRTPPSRGSATTASLTRPWRSMAGLGSTFWPQQASRAGIAPWH